MIDQDPTTIKHAKLASLVLATLNKFASLTYVLLGVELALGTTQASHAQAYGPRQFWLAPSGLNVGIVTDFYNEGDSVLDNGTTYPGLNISTNAIVPSYIRFFGLAGQSAQFSIGVPYAWANVDISESSQGLRRSVDGFGDLYSHLTVGIVNAPSLQAAEYVAYMTERNPSVVMYSLLGVTAPTGEYDDDRVVNIGTNRWSFRAALPTTIRLSRNWNPGQVTTLELLPSVDIYTPNHNPPLSNRRVLGIRLGDTELVPNKTTQQPLFAFEAHLTHDITDKIWVSLDSYSKIGGVTSNDGKSQNNQQVWTALGGTIGIVPWKSGRLTVSGGGVVARNKESLNGWQVRVELQQSFF